MFGNKQEKIRSSLKKVKDCRMRLAVDVEAELVELRLSEVFREIQKAARLPGFREGKAPLDLVQKKFEKEAGEEVLKSLIPEAYHHAVSKHNLTPVTLPTISEIKMEKGKPLTFTAEFDNAPEVSVKNYKGIRIKKVPIDVQTEDLEKGIGSLLESRAELVPLLEPRAVQKGDFIVSDIEIWQNNQYVPGKKGVLLAAEPGGQDDFYEKIVGAQVDEVREISVDFSQEEKKQGLVGRKPFYKVWIRGIQQKKLPELTDEFAKQFGKDTVADLREAIRKELAMHKNTESQNRMKDELFGKLLAGATFAVPEGLVVKQKERLLEQARNQYRRMGAENRFDEDRARLEADAAPKALDQVKLYFILQKVAELENIEIDEMELEQKLQALAQESGHPAEEVKRVFEEDLRESLKEKKTIDFLLAHAKFEE